MCAYRYDQETGDIIIDGWEQGIAPSPHKGIANLQAVNIDTESGEVMANYARVQQSQVNSSSTFTINPLNSTHVTLGNGSPVIVAGIWINVSASTITGLSTGNYYVLSNAASFTSAQLALTYNGAAITGLGASGTATASILRNFGKPIASAVEQYSDGTNYQFRYYIYDANGLLWVYDTASSGITAGLTWFLPDYSITYYGSATPTGMAVLNGWVHAFAGNTIWCKPTVNLGDTTSNTTTWAAFAPGLMMSILTSPNPHFALVGHQGRMYYTDGNFIGSVFPNSSLLSGGANIQSYASYTGSSTTGTIATLFDGSIPTFGGTSSLLVPAAFFCSSGGSVPSALTAGTIYWIKYSLGNGGTLGTFQVFASSGSQTIISVSINQPGKNYSVNDVLTVSGGNGDATLTVQSVDFSGAITAVSISAAGTGYTSANNVTVTGGNGTNATFNTVTGTGSALNLATGASGTQYFNTYYPTSTSGKQTITFTPQRLNLPFFEISTSLAENGNLVIIGTKLNTLYPWNQVDVTPSDLIPLPENNVSSMLTVNNTVYIFAGNKGNIYLTNGSAVTKALTVPDYCAGIPGTPASYVEPYFTWGGNAYIRGRIYFSILDQTSAKAGNCGGVWSFVPTQNMFFGQDVGLSIRQENRSSYGTYNGVSQVILASLNQAGLGTQYWNAWQSSISSPTYGIDFTDTTPSTEALIETDAIPIGSLLKKTTPSQVEYKLGAPADETTSVSIKYRLNTSDAYTSMGTAITEGANPISGFFTVNFQNAQWVQLQVKIQPDTSTSSSFIPLRELRIK